MGDFSSYPYYGSIDQDPLIADALNRILSDYGVHASVREKAKSLLKFGRNPNVGTSLATIWYTGQDGAAVAMFYGRWQPAAEGVDDG